MSIRSREQSKCNEKAGHCDVACVSMVSSRRTSSQSLSAVAADSTRCDNLVTQLLLDQHQFIRRILDALLQRTEFNTELLLRLGAVEGEMVVVRDLGDVDFRKAVGELGVRTRDDVDDFFIFLDDGKPTTKSACC